MTVESRHSDKEASNGFNDDADMRRLGKRQDFRVRAEDTQPAQSHMLTTSQRNFQFVSITAFAVITISGWVFVPRCEPAYKIRDSIWRGDRI
jgi:hypothetical protein